MATMALQPVRSLRQVAPDTICASNAVMRLLAGSGATAQVVPAVDAVQRCFVVNDALAFALAEMPDATEDFDGLCDQLDHADPLLSLVERHIGLGFEPVAVLPLADTAFGNPDAVLFHVEKDGVSVWLAFVPDADAVVAWEARVATLPPDLTAVPQPVALLCRAAQLSIADAAGMAVDDLLLLPHRMRAELDGTGHGGVFDSALGQWTTDGQQFDGDDGIMAESEDENSPPTSPAGIGGFTVPVTMRLPAQHIDAGTLSAIAPGMVIPLAPLSAGLWVELLVGGRMVARGEIVEMGDRFAVHIDEAVSPVTASVTSEED